MHIPTEYAAEEARIKAAYAHRDTTPEILKRESHFDRACLFMMQEQEREILALLRRHGREDLANQKILEVGCGVGGNLRRLIKWGARPENVVGLDLFCRRISIRQDGFLPMAFLFTAATPQTFRFPMGLSI